MKLLEYFGYFLGSAAAIALAGLLASWVDRKVTARLQWRVGPPWWQNFADLAKFAGKEVLVPAQADRAIFLASPLIAVIGVGVSGALLLLAFTGRFSFQGDVILFLYLLMLPSLAIIMGGSASDNVLASVGVSRELKLLIGYELPFICALLVPVVKCGGTISLAEIIAWQSTHGAVAGSLSGLIAFIVALFAIQGKLGFIPFDVAEAEGEIGAGALIEYSGILLGMFKLAKAMLLVVGPLFLAALYLGGASSGGAAGIVTGVLKYVLVLVLVILIKNTNPRLRIDQILRFFWGALAVAGVLAVLMAFVGW